MHDVFERCESEVRSYCRSFPAVFNRAQGPFLYDESGREYIDFFAGAGTLNYGHNHPRIKQAVMEYLQRDGVVHALDMWTVAKREFLETFEALILKPRNLDYKIQFTGPTGTNAVEAALKLARKVKQRSNVIAFTNGYHGLSAGALAITGNRHFRNEAFVNRLDVSFMPYDGYFGEGVNTLDYLRRFLLDNSSGVDVPAAIIVETIQAEGGVNVARLEWLRGLEKLCREFDILLIVDDIQVGNGRTGKFFSFEEAGIRPDLVTLSKAIGGLGLPMSLVFIAPEIDVWKPAEHTGTFRGNNLAFVAATAALQFWRTSEFSAEVARKGRILEQLLSEIQARHPRQQLRVRGRGLIYGLQMPRPDLAKAVSREAFRQGIIIELAGPNDEVLKFLPPLVIEEATLRKGVSTLSQIVASVLK
ncbi:MAG: diaminobutyrate--2-oxoglutarate transaminase [Verrucomicrobiota bacterium]|jgi:diaminobutyrate-2-oxoglutarate transaminase